jgi:hypothetical protein
MAKYGICVTRTALLFCHSFLAPSLSAAHEARNCPSQTCGSQAHTDRSTQNYQSQFVEDANLLLTEQIIGTVPMRDTELFTAVKTSIFVFRVIPHGAV